MEGERRKFGMTLAFAVLFATLAFVSIGCASASTIYVPDDYAAIQDAVNAASPGDTIVVRDGTCYENVNVNKRLTIRSENGPANCIIDGGGSRDAISLNADGVKIEGFTVRNRYKYGAIFLSSNNNTITNNSISNNEGGIYLYHSNNNIITNNSISNNYEGIFSAFSSNNNTITNNSISNNHYGIGLFSSNNNIYLNNFIDNDDNYHPRHSTNIWSSKQKITYTYNGNQYTNYLGNYWSDYEGSDVDGDGIGDTPYSIDGDRDNYPLMYFAPTPTPEGKGVPGFELLVGLVALISALYLIRRWRR